MQELELLGRGVIAGLIIAAPPGPVNVVCMQSTLARGWRCGLVCGFATAAVDTLYGAVAAFSINIVIAFLNRELALIRFLAGMLLVAAGIFCGCRRPVAVPSSRAYPIATFLVNLANPSVVLSFLAVLAALGLGGRRHWSLTLFVVAGIFCGSMLWWTALCTSVSSFRLRLDELRLKRMKRAAGLLMAGFGIAIILLSHAAKPLAGRHGASGAEACPNRMGNPVKRLPGE